MTEYEKGLLKAVEIIERNKWYKGAVTLQEIQDDILIEIGKDRKEPIQYRIENIALTWP